MKHLLPVILPWLMLFLFHNMLLAQNYRTDAVSRISSTAKESVVKYENSGKSKADPLYSFQCPGPSNVGIDYDPVRGGYWLATEQSHVYLVDPDDGMVILDIDMIGKVIASDGDQNGIDVLPSGNLLFTDYNGDLATIDDYIFEFDPETETMVNYWPTSNTYNTSTDGTEVNNIIDVAMGSDGFVYATSSVDNFIYKLQLVPGMPGSWSTIATINAQGVANVMGIDELCGNWVISDYNSASVAFLHNSFVLNTTINAYHNSNTFNSGVCFREDANPSQIAVVDYGLNHVGVFESGIIPVDFPVINSITGEIDICPNTGTTLEVEGLLGSANDWYWYLDGCGNNLVFVGNPFITPALASNTTYSVRGEGGCVYNQPCEDIIVHAGDIQPPEVTCPSTQSVSSDETQTYTVSGTDFDPVVDDNCDIALIVNNYNSSSTLDGAIFPVGTTIVTWTAEDGSGNTQTCMFVVQVVDNSSISDLKKIGFNISPNPSNGIFYIEHKFMEQVSVEILDCGGRTVFENHAVNNRSRVDISGHPKGIYIIRVIMGKEIYHGKLLLR